MRVSSRTLRTTPGPNRVYIVIGGLLVSPIVRMANLVITDVLNEQPNTAALTVNVEAHIPPSGAFDAGGFDAGGFSTEPVPWTLPTITVGQPIQIYEGGFDAASQLFGGSLVQVQQFYDLQNPENVGYHLSCTDHTRGLNRRKVSKSYATQSATAIVLDIMATRAADGFTTLHVAAGLPAVAIDFTFEDVNRALTRLANRIGGYWYVDYQKDLHFFLEEPDDAPAPLEADGEPFADLTTETDLSQVRTRVLVEGMGSLALAPLTPGLTMIPVVDPTPFPAGAGLVVSGPQRIAYTDVLAGGRGSLVGPGAQPSAAPGLTAAAGTGVDAGVHGYAITYQTAAGESLPGPTSSIDVGTVPAPASAPVAGAAAGGGAVDDGAHDYVATFVTAAGETTPGPASSSVTTGAPGGVVSPPSSAPAAYPNSGPTHAGSPIVAIGDVCYAQVVYVNASGTTTPGPQSGSVTIPEWTGHPGEPGLMLLDTIPVSADPTVTGKRIYLNKNGTWAGYSNHANAVTTVSVPPIGFVSGGGAPPSSNTAATGFKRTVPLTGIPTGGGAVTGRKLYRRFNATGTYKLVTTIADNTTTTYTDTTANASLGAAAPATNTAAALQVAVTLPVSSSSSVTGRRLYRTAAGASQLKLVTTIANNTATSYTDATPDSALGANVPTADTSNLPQPTGQVNAGATTVPVASTAAFASGGGWAVLGNGDQVVRYTGVAAGALTGLPATGAGSLTATVVYNTTITAAPTLVGVPGAGDGAIVNAIGKGQDLNVLVVRDDLAAQSAIAAIEGGDGIIEHYIQDRRLSAASAATTADAELALFKAPEIRVRYTTRDPRTRSGKTIVVNVPPPTALVGSFLIQRVQLSQFQFPGVAPLRTVEASSTRFSFDDVLRRLELEVYA